METSPGLTRVGSAALGRDAGAGHAVPHCSSKPLYKQITARGRSVAAFQGKIVVERDAQKTDAKLMMQGLMLSDEAQILSKPELEIFADDVVGHAARPGRARRGLAVLSG